MNLQSRFLPVARRVAPEARLRGVRRLLGGMSAEITVLELEHPDGRAEGLVVREYGTKNLAADRHPAGTETELLRQLADHGLPVPTPRYADDTGDLLGGPFCVIDFIDADPPPPTWSAAVADQFVELLAQLHRLPPGPALDRLGRYADKVDRWLAAAPEQPDESMRETLIRNRLGAWWPRHNEHPARILHGDIWPGNTLWHGNRMVVAIDWEDAAVGDPRSDLANLRMELVWAYGVDAAEDFTRRYAAARAGELDLDGLPYWDLVAARRPVGRLGEWGLDPRRLDRHLARFQGFVDRALDRIG
ncbi:phosphotransferase family protein [Microlunatus elymi]|uniref:phosphotransferase family protein n=1 Tax=Microlunatus elymi TaxID=2596828 RepID=UPI00143D03E7|nr:phosphotransferase [Microlunatus elymi]